MGAGKFMPKARRGGSPQGGLSRLDHCSCHPGAWGLKKGLRRARRRVDKEVVRRDLDEQ